MPNDMANYSYEGVTMSKEVGDDADDNSDDESVEDGEIVEAASSRWEPPQRGILFHGAEIVEDGEVVGEGLGTRWVPPCACNPQLWQQPTQHWQQPSSSNEQLMTSVRRDVADTEHTTDQTKRRRLDALSLNTDSASVSVIGSSSSASGSGGDQLGGSHTVFAGDSSANGGDNASMAVRSSEVRQKLNNEEQVIADTERLGSDEDTPPSLSSHTISVERLVPLQPAFTISTSFDNDNNLTIRQQIGLQKKGRVGPPRVEANNAREANLKLEAALREQIYTVGSKCYSSILRTRGTTAKDAWDKTVNLLDDKFTGILTPLSSLVESVLRDVVVKLTKDKLFKIERRKGSQAMSLSKEQIATKEEIISELLTIQNVSVHPDSAVHAADAISMIHPGDCATVCLLHCRLQDSRKAITLGTGQNSVNGLDTSLICGCCSVDCLEVISRGFNSNHVFGCAIPNVLIFNLNGGDCTTLSDEFQYCPKVTAVSGMVLAGIMNTFDDGLDRLDACRCFFRLDGSSSGGDEMFMPYLNPTVPICKASQYHIHLARKLCDFWDIEEQRRKMTEATAAIAKHQEMCYQLYEFIHGTILPRPLKNCLECGLDEKRLVFISMLLEDVQKAIEDTWYDVDKLLGFLKPRRWRYLYPILSYQDSIMPQWIKIFVNNNLDELTKDATIETALSLLGTRSVQKQCEALDCTHKELMEKKMAKGMENLGLSGHAPAVLGALGGQASGGGGRPAGGHNKGGTTFAVRPASKRGSYQSIETFLSSTSGISKDVGKHSRHLNKWLLRIQYQCKQRFIASFATHDEATRANVAARRVLAPTSLGDLTDEQIKENIELARKAALLM